MGGYLGSIRPGIAAKAGGELDLAVGGGNRMEAGVRGNDGRKSLLLSAERSDPELRPAPLDRFVA